MNPKNKSASKSKSTKAKKLAAKVVSTQPGFPIEITERKQAEEKLASSQKQLNDLNELQGLLLHPNPIQNLDNKTRRPLRNRLHACASDGGPACLPLPGALFTFDEQFRPLYQHG